jgi:hypothetical protein
MSDDVSSYEPIGHTATQDMETMQDQLNKSSLNKSGMINRSGFVKAKSF